jgi:hypothetical protein
MHGGGSEVREMIARQKAAIQRLRRPSNAKPDPAAPPLHPAPVVIAKRIAEISDTQFIADTKERIAWIHNSLTELENVTLPGLRSRMENLTDRMAKYEQSAEPPPEILPSMTVILQTVARAYEFNLRDLTGQRRSAEYVRARQVAIYLCSNLTGHSQAAIGRFLGRDHTTVIYAIRKIRRQRYADALLDKKISELEAELKMAF